MGEIPDPTSITGKTFCSCYPATPLELNTLGPVLDGPLDLPLIALPLPWLSFLPWLISWPPPFFSGSMCSLPRPELDGRLFLGPQPGPQLPILISASTSLWDYPSPCMPIKQKEVLFYLISSKYILTCLTWTSLFF